MKRALLSIPRFSISRRLPWLALSSLALALLPSLGCASAVESSKREDQARREVPVPICLEALERHGVTRLDARSGPFDPSRHEAVMQVPAARRPPNQIVEQFEPGYSLHDRLLRPAKVSVSAKPRVEGEQNDD